MSTTQLVPVMPVETNHAKKPASERVIHDLGQESSDRQVSTDPNLD